MFSVYYTAVTTDETFVHILSRNSYLTARLYRERRVVALLEVDLVDLVGSTLLQAMDLGGSTLLQKIKAILVDGNENDFDLKD